MKAECQPPHPLLPKNWSHQTHKNREIYQVWPAFGLREQLSCPCALPCMGSRPRIATFWQSVFNSSLLRISVLFLLLPLLFKGRSQTSCPLPVPKAREDGPTITLQLQSWDNSLVVGSQHYHWALCCHRVRGSESLPSPDYLALEQDPQYFLGDHPHFVFPLMTFCYRNTVPQCNNQWLTFDKSRSDLIVSISKSNMVLFLLQIYIDCPWLPRLTTVCPVIVMRNFIFLSPGYQGNLVPLFPLFVLMCKKRLWSDH